MMFSPEMLNQLIAQAERHLIGTCDANIWMYVSRFAVSRIHHIRAFVLLVDQKVVE